MARQMMRRFIVNVIASLVLASTLGAAAAELEYTFTTLAGLAGSAGSADGVGGAARFSGPEGVAVDSAGNVYLADRGNKTIRKILPSGVASTLAGLAGSTTYADGTGSAARFDGPSGMAVDSAGNVFVSDGSARTIRKITPGPTRSSSSRWTVGLRRASSTSRCSRARPRFTRASTFWRRPGWRIASGLP